MPTMKFLAFVFFLTTFYTYINASPAFPMDYSTTCEDQLSKYRKFILQAVLNFEDVCDFYRPENSHGLLRDDLPQERNEIWAFFKLLMAQFNDVAFVGIIRDAVLERCRTRFIRDEKRNSVVLGKKQRFHSWGGKRSSQQTSEYPVPTGDEKYTEKPYFL